MSKHSTPPRPRPAYWWCQAGGWGLYLLFNLFISEGLTGFSWQRANGYLVLSLAGILLTQGFRGFLLRRAWIGLPVGKLIPRVLAADLVLAIALVAIVTLYFCILPASRRPSFGAHGGAAVAATWFIYVFNDFVILILWSGIYFGVAHFHASAELKWNATRREQLHISVRNTGTLRALPNDSTGLGLKNLRTRLDLLFGERATLTLHEKPVGWVEARLVLPASKNLEPALR